MSTRNIWKMKSFGLAELHLHQADLVHTVPDFAAAPLTAMELISEIGVDMSAFPTSKHLAS